MKVEELIEAYKKARKTKKEYDFSKHITLKYMPHAQKIALVKSIVESTSFVQVGEKMVYKRNTPEMYFIFTMKLVERYTDIEVDAKDIVSEYDNLMAAGLMDGLLSVIPEDEYNILNGMLEMARDDFEINTRSLTSFFETKADFLHLFFDKLFTVLEKPGIQEKLNELINTK